MIRIMRTERGRAQQKIKGNWPWERAECCNHRRGGHQRKSGGERVTVVPPPTTRTSWAQLGLRPPRRRGGGREAARLGGPGVERVSFGDRAANSS